MKKRALLAGLVAASAAVGAVGAEPPLVDVRVMAPDTALEVARAALADCRSKGFQVAVAVVDAMGTTQVLLRDRYAGPHTPETARRKAWTAVSFRRDTLDLAQDTGVFTGQAGARQIEGVLMIGGGVPVTVAGSLVGGVGISGGPDGEHDDACARAGIESVREKLELAD